MGDQKTVQPAQPPKTDQPVQLVQLVEAAQPGAVLDKEQAKAFDQSVALKKAMTTLIQGVFALVMGAYLVLPSATITDFISSLGINNVAVKMLLIGAALGVQRYYANKSKNS